MRMTVCAVIAGVLAATAAPAFAGTDCDGGYKTFLGSMAVYIERTAKTDLADAVRKSLAAYDSCKAGDAYSPVVVWNKIIEDMKFKTAE